ncbi:MAG: CDGSH iron-sulfur domain-containing protein [bacterium]|nr:CDGSH iron-sulfur domain-containing protein [bacterium]
MADDSVKMKLIPNGPILIETGKCEIMLVDGKLVEKNAPFTLCRCGASAEKPLCDGAHKTCGFKG